DAGTTDNLVQGNLIGTDASGTVALGNFQRGVAVLDASHNTIGGATAAARNVIAANGSVLDRLSGGGVIVGGSANVVAGHSIGTDVPGSRDLGNVYAGVEIANSPDNQVVTLDSAARQVISGTDRIAVPAPGSTELEGDGIQIFGLGSTRNLLRGSFIGTD